MNNQTFVGFTVDDIGYDGYSTVEHLNNILDFCDELDIKATFFAVPLVGRKSLDKRPEYISLLKEALKRGHEVAQHGLTHGRFEIGIPPQMVLDLPHEKATKKYLEENRKKIEETQSIENIRNILKKGREIIENAVACPIQGFRSPALQSCINMFTALEAEGYQYDSSVYLQKAGWDLINGIDYIPAGINRHIFDQSQKSRTMLELPLTAEYTWYLQKEKFNQALDLAIHDFNACSESGIPFVNVSHVSPLQEGEDGNLGFDFYRKLISVARENFSDLRCLTLSEISKEFIYQGD